MRQLVLISIVATGCMASEWVECDDGAVCPPGFVCSASGCLSGEQIAACAGKEELAACAVVGIEEGRCRDGHCAAARCGDAFVDSGEVCDDGNELDGDGCNRSCTSDETCGNGIIDLGAGEQCDDANSFARDGCSKRCLAERFEWRVVSNTAIPERRVQTAFAYDTARGRFVMFGGQPSNADIDFSDTWELHGATWIRRPVAIHPQGRRGHAMTYDAARGRVVLFGGTTVDEVAFGDTWEYDGTSWTQLTPIASPPAQSGHAMTYDSARQRVVLLGSDAAAGSAHWEYDGTTWELRGAGPPPRTEALLVYDPVVDRLVLNGGRTCRIDENFPFPICNALFETWVYDSATSTWQPNLDAGTQLGQGLYFDVARGRVVLVTSVSNSWRAFTYETAAGVTSWTQQAGSAPITLSNLGLGAGYDLARRRGVFHVGSGGLELPEEFAVDSWTFLAANPSPPPRSNAAMAYDGNRQQVVLFGGLGATGDLGDTWEFDGTEWIAVSTSGATPAPRSDAAMAYDPRRKQVVLVGGRTTGDRTAWGFDGKSWQPLSTLPEAPRCAALAYDDAGARLVLVTRQDFDCRPQPTGPSLGGVWVLPSTATTWSEIPPTATGPGDRTAGSLTYDASRRRIVLFGGYNGLWRNDTWELDGDTWQPIAPPDAPSPRQSGAFAFDLVRQRAFLFGGMAADLVFGDNWELAGSSWVESDIAGPPSRFAPTIVYDAARARMVMFGGRDATGRLADTWTLGYETLDPVEVCSGALDLDGDGAIGCADADCWGTCSPLCAPGMPCPADAARCGDGICASENCRNCPEDCPVGTPSCPIECGDNFCDPGETAENCPGDC